MLIWIKRGARVLAIVKSGCALNDVSNENRRVRVSIGVRGKYEKECCSPPHRAAARRRLLSRGHGRSNHLRQALLAERSPQLAWPDP
jgi:hypothetical protein